LQEYNLNNKENDKHIESNRCTDELRTNGAAAAKSQAEPSEPLSASHRTASRMSLASATSECSFNQDLVSRLPKIPDIAPERTVETGMSLPVGGSKHINPHNYISRPAYFETEDSPLYAMSEQSRRAGNGKHVYHILKVSNQDESDFCFCKKLQQMQLFRACLTLCFRLLV